MKTSHSSSSSEPSLGLSGRIAKRFLTDRITPLIALVLFLIGLFAVVVTPKEEEPQINVTMANVLIPFPGATVQDVEQMVSVPAEQVLSQIHGVEHVMSVSQAGLSVITVQFEVGVPRTEALVRLYDVVNANQDWLPAGLGTLPPVVKPKGIDDVPIVSFTLTTSRAQDQGVYLEQWAHQIEEDLKRVSGTREVRTIGAAGRSIRVLVDPTRMAARGFTLADVYGVLSTANAGSPVGELLTNQQSIAVQTGPFIQNKTDVENLVIGIRQAVPVTLRDVAQVIDGPAQLSQSVWFAKRGPDQPAITGGSSDQMRPAVTIAITKKPGENAVNVARSLIQQMDDLKTNRLPKDIAVEVTRNYGHTADQKAKQLIQKLLFATASVVALVYLALGRREALIVGAAVVLTLAATMFASWAYGFTINRVSLFALIFSIGILVDDAIVVVENIHRHRHLHPDKTLVELIPGAVDEVGGPTILATLTVIAALLPMAFVSGLMGPYMSPIPINASMGMLLSLAIAFVVTPWMSAKWMSFKGHDHDASVAEAQDPHQVKGLSAKLLPLLQRIFAPFLDEKSGRFARWMLSLGVAGAIAVSVLLPVAGLVVLKMLPFDNKSEFQVVVDLPEGARIEKTQAVLRALGERLLKDPNVTDLQVYAGTAAPINFNGLVRQYYFRQAPHLGDIQVNLLEKSDRSKKSHEIAAGLREDLVAIGRPFGANVKVVEVPPGPPVLAPIVAEIYGPTEQGRQALTAQVRKALGTTAHVVDVDDSLVAAGPKVFLVIDRRKANLMGVSQATIVQTLRAALSGFDASYLRDGSKYPVPVQIRLPEMNQQSLKDLLSLTVRTSTRESVALSQFVSVVDAQREQTRFRKDLLPMSFVTADVSGGSDSPLYGLFGSRSQLSGLRGADGKPVDEYFISQPSDPYKNYAIKWDGEWQVTYETFRDMGAAYAVGLVLIYLLVVAHFGSYLMPLVIMAPIPLTIIGVMPGHALLGSQFTATSMIGMIALAGIIVRNSILLVDFIRLQTDSGMPFKQAVVLSAATRAQPIVLTALAAMLGALFILDDPIFNGLAISLLFGILVSTALTLVVIPLLYFVLYKPKGA
jgi:multidrug efflux pump subunit AcrB